jgi:protein-ribulosamine 3-kinase
MIPQEVKDSLESFLAEKFSGDLQIHSNVSLSGGCINNVCLLKTNFGDFCLKYNRSTAFPGMFESEAKGLLLLKEADEVRVPGVICTDSGNAYSYILLEFISPGTPGKEMMADFGRSLARLHRHSADFFGGDHDNYMGSLPQSNRKHSGWISFFIEERLEKQVMLAQSSGFLSSEISGCFGRLYKRLDTIFPKENPSLLHGDLWGGNYLVGETGKACLIDPAVYFGHREIDIAMTTLFGGFDNSFYTSYHEEFPLEKGWKDRLDIFNLYPLLVHLNLFGSGYLNQIESIVRKY